MSRLISARNAQKASGPFLLLSAFATIFAIVALLSSCSVFMPTHKLDSSTPFGYNDDGLQKVREAGLVDKINDTKTVNGKSITLVEAYYDKSRISINLASYNKSVNVKDLDFELQYGGKTLNWSASQSDEAISIMADDVDRLPAMINLNLTAKVKTDLGTVFRFDILLDRTEADKKTEDFITNQTKQTDLLRVIISRVLFTPSTIAIDYSYDGSSNDNGYYIKLANEPNVFESGNTSSHITETLTGNQIEGTAKVMFAPISPSPKVLNLVVYKTSNSSDATTQEIEIMKINIDLKSKGSNKR
jgi:hypothetical protein